MFDRLSTVLIAVCLIGLFGFLALCFGVMALQDYRREQIASAEQAAQFNR